MCELRAFLYPDRAQIQETEWLWFYILGHSTHPYRRMQRRVWKTNKGKCCLHWKHWNWRGTYSGKILRVLIAYVWLKIYLTYWWFDLIWFFHFQFLGDWCDMCLLFGQNNQEWIWNCVRKKTHHSMAMDFHTLIWRNEFIII